MKVDVHGDRIQGKRPYQEDEFFRSEIDPSSLSPTPPDDQPRPHLIVLADGMGGEGGGDIASQLVVETFHSRFGGMRGTVRKRLETALNSANNALLARKDDEPDLPPNMGCTLIGAAITPSGLEWISVGDSLLFLVRNGQLYKINEDHSGATMLAKLVADGQMSEEDAVHDPRRHMLHSAVTGHEIPLVDISKKAMPLKAGDLVILASDGLETLSPDQILEIAMENLSGGASAVVNRMLDAVESANKRGQDNATVVAALIPADLPSGAPADVENLTVTTTRTHTTERPLPTFKRRTPKPIVVIAVLGALAFFGAVGFVVLQKSGALQVLFGPGAPGGNAGQSNDLNTTQPANNADAQPGALHQSGQGAESAAPSEQSGDTGKAVSTPPVPATRQPSQSPPAQQSKDQSGNAQQPSTGDGALSATKDQSNNQ